MAGDTPDTPPERLTPLAPMRESLRPTPLRVDADVELEDTVEVHDTRGAKLGTMELTLTFARSLMRASDKRSGEQTEAFAAYAQSTAAGYRMIIMALILVLLVLVSGVIGVSVTGHIPGVGDIRIVEAGAGDDR